MDVERKFWALKEIDFTLPQGGVMGVIGTNGSGKSTLLKVLSGLLKPDEGAVDVQGRIAPLLELGTGFEPSLSGAENIYFNGAVLNMPRKEIAANFNRIVDFSGLGDLIETPLVHYSTGMAMRLGFSIAAHSPADVLLIDEILAVGDQVFQRRCLDKINELNGQGVSVLFVSHGLAQVKELCKSVLWIHEGRQKFLGPADEATERYLMHTDENYRQIREEQKRAEAAAEKAQKERLDNKGKVVATVGLTFCGENLKPADKFKPHDPLTIRWEYHAKKRVENPIFGLAIHREDGTHICGPNTQDCRFSTGVIEGHGVLLLKMASIPLSPGIYKVSLAIWDSTHTHAYDWGELAYEFEVVSASWYKHRGCVAMDYQWKIQS